MRRIVVVVVLICAIVDQSETSADTSVNSKLPYTYPWSSTLAPRDRPGISPGSGTEMLCFILVTSIMPNTKHSKNRVSGDRAPALKLQTLFGFWTLSRATIFNALDHSSGFSLALWESPASLDALLRPLSHSKVDRYLVLSMNEASELVYLGQDLVDFVFLSWSPSAATDVANLANRIELRMVHLNITTLRRAAMRKRMHFVPVPVERLSGTEMWVRKVLEAWPTVRDQVAIHGIGDVPRLDARCDGS